MKSFKTLAVVKHPRPVVWATVRDHMADLAANMADIAAIEVQQRAERDDGVVTLLNVWRADTRIPSMFASIVTPDMLCWTDRAEWWPDAWETRWQIQPYFVTSGSACIGVTRYEEAMAGRGTRMTFQGQLDFSSVTVPGISGLVFKASSSPLEAFAASLITRNLQQLAHAVSRHLAGC
jgi:hypothetical protein